MKWVLLSFSASSAHGLLVSNGLSSNPVPSKLPPILFLKTHKTGGSTLINILHRLGHAHNMTFMLPEGNINLGWPKEFPGKVYKSAKIPDVETPNHQFDIICNHAVYTPDIMLGYLPTSPPPFRVTLVRENLGQLESAFHYYMSFLSLHNLASKTAPGSLMLTEEGEEELETQLEMAPDNRTSEEKWDEKIMFLQKVADHPDWYWPMLVATFSNPMAFDMGWYREGHGNNAPAYEIKKWIENLGFDLVLVTNYYDQSMVLLRRKLGLEMSEVMSVHMKGKKYNDEDPNPTQMATIKQLYSVDYAIFDHFNTSFWSEWHRDGQNVALDEEVKQLQDLNAKANQACQDKDDSICTWELKTDNMPFNHYLKDFQ